MSSVRLRRLQADFEKLSAYAQRHPRVRLVQAEGNPPEKYQVEFQLRSINQVGGQFAYVDRHLVEIFLPRNYPRMPPQCRMLTPVFHPNIAPHAICIGDHWNAGEPLWSMVMRIGEMLAYQSYNTKSPLNGEAARWVEQNMASLPLDPISLYVDQGNSPAGPAAASPSGAGPTARVVRPGTAPVSPARSQVAATQPQTGDVPTARVVARTPGPAVPGAASPPVPAQPAAPTAASAARTEIPVARVVTKPAASEASATASPPPTVVPVARVVKPGTSAGPAAATSASAAIPSVKAAGVLPGSAAAADSRQSGDIPMARVVGKPGTATSRPPVTAAGAADVITCVCPGCHSSYDVPAAMAGKNARCKKCRTVITIAPS